MKRILIAIACIGLLTALGWYIRQIILETVESPMPGQHYAVALGDSVAAGAGLSGGHRPVDCDVSENAFPSLLGNQLHRPVVQLACSGATVADGPNTVLEQYKAAKPFLADGDVVIYAGANDIGWLKLLTSCTQQNCATGQNRAQIASKLHTLHESLAALLEQIQQAKPHRLVVNTYYALLAGGDTCVAHYGITPEKVSFINEEEAQLNATITAIASEAKATVVAVDFSGHTLCTAEPWVQGVKDPAPLHPTAAGQQQIAKQDAQALAP